MDISIIAILILVLFNAARFYTSKGFGGKLLASIETLAVIIVLVTCYV